MIQIRRLTQEETLYLLAIGLGLGVRLLALGQAPLSEVESGWALSALDLAQGHPVGVGLQPVYTLFTAAWFTLAGSSNFLARLLPALAGSALVGAPFFFRHRLGRPAALIAAFGLAIDPGLVTVSRQAGGPMPALSLVLLALGCWQSGHPLVSGVMVGLAFLSGPTLPPVLIGLGLTGLVTLRQKVETVLEGPQQPGAWKRMAAAALATLLLGSTLFFIVPQGLAAWLGGLAAYFSGWAMPVETDWQRLPAALLFYQPLALLFAGIYGLRLVIKIVQARRNQLPFTPDSFPGLFLSVWALTALLLALLYPARQVADLIVCLVPLWGLAGCELERHLPTGSASDRPALGQGSLILLLLGLLWYTLASLGVSEVTENSLGVRWLAVTGILALAGLTSAMAVLGWSWAIARRGIIWGLYAGGVVYLLAALSGAAYLRPNSPPELWGSGPGSGQVDLLSKTLRDLSEWHTGQPNLVDIVALDSPSLRWLLRDYPHARFMTTPGFTDGASIVIAAQTPTGLVQSAGYRGQDFSWWVRPGWKEALPPDLLHWFTFRQAPLQIDNLILWARSDLFPGVPFEPQTGAPKMPQEDPLPAAP